jgi:uncharacterized membrane protein YphA (DoxX/SURF4 family)
MIRRLFATDDSAATAILRLVLGIVFFAHGAQKMLGWFGGLGFSGTMGFFTGTMHIPPPFAFLAIAAEFFGGVGLVLGLLTRIAAFGIGVTMLVAIVTVNSTARPRGGGRGFRFGARPGPPSCTVPPEGHLRRPARDGECFCRRNNTPGAKSSRSGRFQQKAAKLRRWQPPGSSAEAFLIV